MANKDNPVANLDEPKVIITGKEMLESKSDVLKALGRIEAHGFNAKLNQVMELKTIKEILDTKAYKGLTYRDESGAIQTVNTVDELCDHHLGTSKSSLHERLQNLEVFGEEFLEASVKLGIGGRFLRQARSLPDEKKQQWVDQTLERNASKEEIKALIAELANEAKEEKQALQIELEQTKSTLEVARESSIEKQREIEALKERKHSLKPWEQEAEDIDFAISSSLLTVRQGVIHLAKIADSLSDIEANRGVADDGTWLPTEAVEHASEELVKAVLDGHKFFSDLHMQLEEMFPAAMDEVLRRQLPPASEAEGE